MQNLSRFRYRAKIDTFAFFHPQGLVNVRGTISVNASVIDASNDV
jgi:hypothetical protein